MRVERAGRLIAGDGAKGVADLLGVTPHLNSPSHMSTPLRFVPLPACSAGVFDRLGRDPAFATGTAAPQPPARQVLREDLQDVTALCPQLRRVVGRKHDRGA